MATPAADTPVQNPQQGADNQGEDLQDVGLDELLAPQDDAQAPVDEQAAPDTDDASADDATGDDPSESKSSIAIKDDAEVDVSGQKVTLAELKAGYQRQQDYTVKAMALADEKRDFVARAQAAVVEEKQATVQFIPQIAQKLIEALAPTRNPQEVYALAQGDPAAFAAYQAQQQVVGNLMQWVHGVSAEVLQGALQNKQQFAQGLAQAESQKIQTRAYFNDNWVQKARAHGLKRGIPEARINEYVYAGEMDVLHDAMQWVDAQERIKKGKEIKQPVASEQKGRPNGAVIGSQKQMADIKKQALAGNRNARVSYLSALMPEQDG